MATCEKPVPLEAMFLQDIEALERHSIQLENATSEINTIRASLSTNRMSVIDGFAQRLEEVTRQLDAEKKKNSTLEAKVCNLQEHSDILSKEIVALTAEKQIMKTEIRDLKADKRRVEIHGLSLHDKIVAHFSDREGELEEEKKSDSAGPSVERKLNPSFKRRSYRHLAVRGTTETWEDNPINIASDDAFLVRLKESQPMLCRWYAYLE